MKNIKHIVTFLLLISVSFFKAQDLKNWRNLNTEQRKEIINKLTPEQRVEFLKQFRENMIVDELDVPEDRKEDFRNLYMEYQESQRQIKERFRSNADYEKMTDEEAKEELEKSFIVGQQLLDNRRKYAEKFQNVMKPQRVLQMFQNEGMMRNKMMDRKSDTREQRGREMQERGREYQERGRQMNDNRGMSPYRNNNTRMNSGFRNPNR